MPQRQPEPSQLASRPTATVANIHVAKIYSVGTLTAAGLMLGALCWPANLWPNTIGAAAGENQAVAKGAVMALAAVPLLGTLVTALQAWKHDRQLSYAALLALLGLGLVGFLA